MTSNTYSVGQDVKISAEFRNSAGALTDPTTVVCKYKSPGGTITTKTYPNDGDVVRGATGVYHLIISIPDSGHGTWKYYWKGTGAIKAAGEGYFTVRDSALD